MKSMKSGLRTPLPASRYCRNIVAIYPVHVFSRVRPLRHADRPTCAAVKNDKTIVLSQPEQYQTQRRDRREYHYKFKMAFGPDSLQWDVYQQVAKPLVEQLFDGVNSLLFAYGVTGSGKTYTMTGDANNYGIMPMCLDTIFRAISDCQADKFSFKANNCNGFTLQSAEEARAERRIDVEKKWTEHKKVFHFAECSTLKSRLIKGLDEDNKYAVFVTYYEIYNNSVFDLLEEGAMNKVPQSKVIREDCDHNMYVHGITEVEVKSVSEAMDVFRSGQKRKHMGHTLLNAESSRSHSVFNIRLVTAPTDSQGEELMPVPTHITVTQLALVDLAGSERSARTKNTGAKLREAGNINNSLLTLRTCLDYLRENNKGGQLKKIPYRDSKITLLFKNYFEGEGQISMIVCINPAVEEYDENFHVLKFAEATQELILAKTTPLKIQDSGLTPGRRKANRMFRSAQDRLQKCGYPEAIDVPVEVDLVLNMKFPHYDLDSPDANKVIEELSELLKERIETRRILRHELEFKMDKFRGRLVDSEMEMNMMRCRIATMQLNTEESIAESNALRKKLLQSERTVHDMYQLLPPEHNPKDVEKQRRQLLRSTPIKAYSAVNKHKKTLTEVVVDAGPVTEKRVSRRSKSLLDVKTSAGQKCDVVKGNTGDVCSKSEMRAKGAALQRSKSLTYGNCDNFLCKISEWYKTANKKTHQ